MAGAGLVILFVVSMVGWSIWTAIYVTFASHYFLTIVTESSAGIDEIQFPSEGILDWWWKPLLCLWILGVWVIPIALLTGPLMLASPIAYGIGFGVVFLIVYPLSLLSTLYSGNWFFFMHPQVIWRLLCHFRAFVYVHVMTMLTLSAAAVLVTATFGFSFVWALPASLAIPTTMLLYARHWGRFSWLALNFEASPRRKKKGAKEATRDDAPILEPPPMPVDEAAPEVDVDEVIEPMPAVCSTQKEPVMTAVEVEEDEWSTNKKPYGFAEEGNAPVPEPAPAYASEDVEANQPQSLSNYYDEKAKKEKVAAEKKRAEAGMMLPLSNKKPSFQVALLQGVWPFMIYSGTLQIWINLVLFTAVEFFFLLMLWNFWPQLD